MKAKDTELTQKQIDKVDEQGVIDGDIVPYLKAQAALSFKAGRDSFLDDVGNATIPLSEVYEKGRKAGQGDVILESKMGTLTVSSLVKKGRQEVVEWMMGNNSCPLNSYYGVKIIKEEWQAKLDAWGIE